MRDFVIAMVIFSGLIALWTLAVGSMATEYNNENIVNQDFANNFNKFDNDTQRISEMWNATTGEGGLSLVGTADLIFFSTFRVISLVFNSVVAAGEQLFGVGEFFGIPSEVSSIFMVLIFSALTVLIIFIVLSAVRSGSDI